MSKPLLKDLQELMQAGIISAGTAQDITRYYQSKKDNSSGKFNVVLGLLGALLVGSGLILVIAHNWDELGRTLKTIFAFLPLVIGQGLCLYTFLRKKDNVLWKESSAILLFFAIAGSISLISQIYHISGTLPGFIFTWLLLAFPLIYLLSSSIVSLLFIAAATWFCCLEGYGNLFSSEELPVPYQYIILLALVAPHYYYYIKNKPNSNFFHLHNWFLALSFTITLGAFGNAVSYPWVYLGYCSLFGVFYLVGVSAFFKDYKLLANPFYCIGIPGILFITMNWSYDFLWKITFLKYHMNSYFFAIMLLLLVVIIVYLFINNTKKSVEKQFDFIGLTPFLFLLAVFILPGNTSGPLIINLWILALAIYYIRRGTLQNHLGILNFGLIIIALLAILRFFDNSIPFIWRGAFFVIAGTGFFVANYLLLKKRKLLTQNNTI